MQNDDNLLASYKLMLNSDDKSKMMVVWDLSDLNDTTN